MRARQVGFGLGGSAPAKLNLYLEVLGRRDDGFHELETLMTPVRIYDRLRWQPRQPAERSASFSLRVPSGDAAETSSGCAGRSRRISSGGRLS